MRVAVLESVADVDAAVWNRLVGDGSPFLEWEWLAALENSGCAGPQTGWVPRHLTLWDGSDLVAAVPLYLKSHSLGEFVFDQGWAQAAEQAGLVYYPKLLVGVPFTPVGGRRFLSRPGVDPAATTKLLGERLRDLCVDNRLSSIHVNFCLPEEVELLRPLGFEARAGYQFMWENRGWASFDEYLGAFRSKRRVQIKRERRELEDQAIVIEALTGDAIPDALFEPMFRLYKSTIDKLVWGRQYLNQRLFDLLRESWKHRLCFFVARREGELVAGSLTVRKGEVLYGRYWGAFEEVRFLHFNVCYYASIEYCIGQGLRRFEPGAGGEFKYLRGFDARPTQSAHFLRDPRLADAVRRYLEGERGAVHADIEWLDAHSAVVRVPGKGA